MFDPNANPETVAARAAELALEQLDRLDHHLKMGHSPNGIAFYSEPFEISQSNQIAKLMGAYAVLKGYAKLEDVPHS